MSECGADVIHSRARNVLLVGLSDDDEANRLHVFVSLTLSLLADACQAGSLLLLTL